MFRKFFDVDAPIATSPTPPIPTEPVQSSGTSIAELMAKHGVKSDSNGSSVVVTPVSINQEPKVEPPSEKTDTTAKVEPEKSETATPVTPTPEKVEPTPEPQKVAVVDTPLSWKEVLKQQQPQYNQVLKEMGYSDKLVELVNELKDVDPKVFGFLSTWKSGGDLSKYVSEWTTDYSKMSAEDVMRHQLRQEYPKATSQQLEVLYNREVTKAYSLDSDDENEVSEGRLLLEAKADRYRETLMQNQQNYLMPKPPEPNNQPDVQAIEQAERQKDFEAYEQSVRGDDYTRNIISSKQLSVGDGEEKFNYPLNTDEVMRMILDPDTWAAKFFTPQNQNGKTVYFPNNQKLWLVNAFANDPEGFLKEYAKHHQAIGAKSAIKPIENAKPADSSTIPSAPEKAPQSAAEAMARYGKPNYGG